MALVESESRSRIAIEWYDDEAEAELRAEAVLKNSVGVAEANIGIAQCGRDKGFDKYVNGRKAYAVVTP